MKVKAWKEQVIIPTYGVGKPEKNPVFLEKRVYQGSSGVVYPLPVIEKIMDEKEDKNWNAVFLENDYLKIMILPELGGRIQMAFDKIKNRHFIYYNQVIKPALVGLAGPWISGGIEFNWPQHHRPGTYDPVDVSIEEHTDGSFTVWCNEIERMTRTKGTAGFRLYPGKAYLEINVKLYNRTALPQTFLWWANPAVKVNDHYQSVFPPDVHAVFDHGKRDVSSFPIATGTYYKVDYSSGVDISRYKNIPVPTSYMAITSNYNFVGGYENDTRGGVLHVADHHLSPGKKQWTWGYGDFGKAWDRHLTDEDGPYIELMCGVFTDNQPDFSWIMPYEEKRFSQYFMPYRDLGVVKNATKDALINLEFNHKIVTLKLYTTGVFPNAQIRLYHNTTCIFEERVNFSPEMSYDKEIEIDIPFLDHEIEAILATEGGKQLVSWRPEREKKQTLPEKAKPASDPSGITSVEQLFLTGLHLEQYRHATYNPADYYLEALRREPGDVRNNNAMGLWLLRKGQFNQAEPYFRSAIATLTERNPNPYDGEPFYNLGLCLSYQEKWNEAYASFYKSTWNRAWQEAGYYHLAQLSCRKGDFEQAIQHAEDALVRNNHHHKLRHLLMALYRKTKVHKKASDLIASTLSLDPFNFGVVYEKILLTETTHDLSELKTAIGNNVHSWLEISLDYAACGLFEEAIEFLNLSLSETSPEYPMVYYFLGWYASEKGDEELSLTYFKQAENIPADGCFPHRLEEKTALHYAITKNPQGAKAWYYLGNFWYHHRQYPEAIQCWEKSIGLDQIFPTAHRNLALATYNKLHQSAKALQEMETAYRLEPSDFRVIMELDQLYKKTGKSPSERLTFLENHAEALDYRDDLYLERINLLNLLGNHELALKLLMNRNFHPWEGGEGKVTGQYLLATVELAKIAWLNKAFDLALNYLIATENYPIPLGEGKLSGVQENNILYWKGCVYEGMNVLKDANTCWEQASKGLSEPSAAIFYNDQQPDQIFYQGLALKKLGKDTEANERFQRLLQYGQQHLSDKVKIDYFAVSLPDLLIWEEDLQVRHELHCHYLMGLGSLGLKKFQDAINYFSHVLETDRTHAGALVHLKMAQDFNLLKP